MSLNKLPKELSITGNRLWYIKLCCNLEQSQDETEIMTEVQGLPLMFITAVSWLSFLSVWKVYSIMTNQQTLAAWASYLGTCITYGTSGTSTKIFTYLITVMQWQLATPTAAYLKSFPSWKSQAEAWQIKSLPSGFCSMERSQNVAGIALRFSDVKNSSASLNIFRGV